MSKTEDKRVLNRLGACELTREEADKIAGGLNTFASCTGTASPQYGDSDFDQ